MDGTVKSHFKRQRHRESWLEAINISEARGNIDTQKEPGRQWRETGRKCRVQKFRGHLRGAVGTLKAFMVHGFGVRDHGFPPRYCELS